MKTEFRHSGKYTATTFNIDEVIASLSAQKTLIEEGVNFLAELDPDFDLDRVTVRVESIKTGTLGWDLLIEVYGKYQSNIEDRVTGSLEEMFGIDIPAEYEGIVTLATLAVTYVVARYAYDRVSRSRGETSSTAPIITGDNNVVIQQISSIVGQDPLFIEKALERSLPPSKRRALIPKVADFLRPSKKDKTAKIELQNSPDIEAAALAEFPSDADLKAVDDSTIIDVEGATLDIRGTDRDKINTGWYAIVMNDERFPKRLPMDLYPTVDPEDLAKYQRVLANLAIECERQPDRTLKPKRIHLLSFVAPLSDPDM
ncbi:hypothetical protein [Roseicitreum antarcticum]|uniref:hypothetical protein n=1 Tax=Roseicitreum antarcticum TaxID=564137 RepID=UPI00115FB571|nr:hypothetical protein [Roseicitreum antarcticum]